MYYTPFTFLLTSGAARGLSLYIDIDIDTHIDIHIHIHIHRHRHIYIYIYEYIYISSQVAQLEVGATHVAIRTECGRAYTFGAGTALGLAKAERKQWELTEVCIHLYMGIYIYLCVCACACVRVYIYVCVCVCIYSKRSGWLRRSASSRS